MSIQSVDDLIKLAEASERVEAGDVAVPGQGGDIGVIGQGGDLGVIGQGVGPSEVTGQGDHAEEVISQTIHIETLPGPSHSDDPTGHIVSISEDGNDTQTIILQETDDLGNILEEAGVVHIIVQEECVNEVETTAVISDSLGELLDRIASITGEAVSRETLASLSKGDSVSIGLAEEDIVDRITGSNRQQDEEGGSGRHGDDQNSGTVVQRGNRNSPSLQTESFTYTEKFQDGELKSYQGASEVVDEGTGEAASGKDDNTDEGNVKVKKKKRKKKKKALKKSNVEDASIMDEDQSASPTKSIRPIKCDGCHKVFNDQTAFKNHRIASGERPYSCHECKLTFVWKVDIARHNRENHVYKCEDCNKLFPTRMTLDVHLFQTHNKPAHHRCDECNKKFLSPEALRDHVKCHQNAPKSKCETCGKMFITKYLRQHMLQHSGSKPYLCDICGLGFTTKRSVKFHKSIHSGDKPFACNICQKTFRLEALVRSHQRTHTNSKPFQCSYCSKAFISNSDLQRHLQVHTSQWKFKCSVCDQGFGQKGQLDTHFRKHTGEKPFKCDQCPSSYRSWKSLKDHKKTHLDVKPYTCKICGKGYIRNALLQQHMQIHVQAEIKCKTCGVIVQRLDLYRNHMKQHREEKEKACNYECHICQKKFSIHVRYQRHLELHAERGTTIFPCDICNKRFKSQAILDSHRTKKHNCPPDPSKPEVLAEYQQPGQSYVQHQHIEQQHPYPQQQPHPQQQPQHQQLAQLQPQLPQQQLVQHQQFQLPQVQPQPLQPQPLQSQLSQLQELPQHQHQEIQQTHHLEHQQLSQLQPQLSQYSQQQLPQQQIQPPQLLSQPQMQPQQQLPLIQQHHPPATEQQNVEVATQSMNDQGNFFTCTMCQQSCEIAEKYESQRTPGSHLCIKCHLKEGSLMNKIRYKCAICDRLFIDLQKAQLHSKAHANTPEVSVSVTDATDQTYMVQIVDSDRDQGGNRVIHYCDICGKGYTWINSLHRHKKLHCTENLKIKNTSFKNYKCDLCGKGFTWRSNLNRHKQTHRDKIIYIFRTDGEDMTLEEDTSAMDKPLHVEGVEGTDYLDVDETYNNIIEEQVDETNVDKTYTCDVCGKSFLWQSTMETHRQTHFGFGTTNQPNIDNAMTYSTNVASINNMQNPAPMGQMNNQNDMGNMQQPGNMIIIPEQSNIMNVNNPNVHGNVTHQNMAGMAGMSGNIVNLNPENTVPVQLPLANYVCSMCGSNFYTQKDLEIHKQNHLIPEVVIGYSDSNQMEYPALPSDKKFVCEVCGKGFSWSNSLSRHKQVHKRNVSSMAAGSSLSEQEDLQKPYKCDFCGKGFARRDNLTYHKRIHQGHKPYTCTICKKSFNWGSYFKQHMVMHKGEKPYACKFCGKAYAWNLLLQNHMRTHTGEKPFRCDICEKLFRQRSHLTVHMRSHTGEKMSECTICKKKFFDSSSLRRHMRIHSKEKPYTCDVCEKHFSDSSNLKSHLRRHSGAKPFECGACGKCFSVKQNLTRHFSVHRKEEALAQERMDAIKDEVAT